MKTDTMRVARPHLIRAALAGVLAIAAEVVAATAGQFKDIRAENDEATDPERLIAVICAVIVLVAGIAAVRALGTAIRKALTAHGDTSRAAPIAFGVSALGYAIVILAVLGLLGIKLEKLLVGTALTGVILGIAAQQSLGNLFAGIMLLAARPFAVGERILLRSGPLGGEYEGVIVDMSLLYVKMLTDQGPVLLPNSGVLTAAIGPGARQPEKKEGQTTIDEG
ncbi:MAG: mechanosensitive ion channel domain-containing protein [Actinomycetota bacterium]